ncbi:hypothetical protein C806_00058 [Lachnospiraceae bacterium 3-1]|nr:hypothetical protein C806_00058 [Lachnospiraceae bacterium 3-1]
MAFEIPDVIEQIRDIKAIYDMNDKINPIKDAENLEKDLFTGTATRQGIARREKLYGIIPADTDTLEDRRFRVMAKENDRIPYTLRSMKKKLENLCGAEGYRLSITENKVEIRVALIRKTMFQDVTNMAEHMVPLNMSLDCSLLYNQHTTLGKFTHRQLAMYTQNQIRNEVLVNGD